MGGYFKLVDHLEKFNSIKSSKPVIINYLDNKTEDQKKLINDVIYTTNGDLYDSIPACQCRERKGALRKGEICRNCGTPVRDEIDELIEPLVWIRQPPGVAPLIKPHLLLMLRLRFSQGTSNAFDTIQYLIDPNYKPTDMSSPKTEKLIELLDKHNLHVRSYNFFVENFDTYMDFLFNCILFKKKSDQDYLLYQLIQENRDKVFSEYLPTPNKSLLIIEKTRFSTYIDESISIAIEALRHVTGIDNQTSTLSVNTKQRRVAKCLILLSEYYHSVYAKSLSPKRELIRKHVISSRSDYTFRTVISSLTGKHRYDEIHVPWPVAVNFFYNHLAGILLKEGWTPNEIYNALDKYNLEPIDKLREFMNKLINDAGPKGYPVLQNRNPSLGRGSIQRVYITKIKKDPRDITTSLSILIVKEFNADRR